ncbi:hypothetical protein P879_06687 [Paragonimus westermani]|uniref:Letm1 RBD domain-containing protein n=1 Tax=Paragonimus westermani TaxID=34504 RepID=A0A8T0D9P1_9TREM|nr:hypothetical protein P879_06687 [Paragonimus westermani]
MWTKLVTSGISFYQKLVIRLEEKWADRHPPSFHNYVLFKKGTSATLVDINDLLRIWTRSALEGSRLSQLLPALSRRELYVLRQVPRDLVRLSPVLLLAPLPGTIFILPLFFAFPRLFLNRSFWTDEQRDRFDAEQLHFRQHVAARHVLTNVHDAYSRLRLDPHTSAPMNQYLDLLHFVHEQILIGTCLSSECLTRLEPLFRDKLTLEKLSKTHVFSLCLLHDLPVRVRFSPFRRWPWLRTYLEPDYFHLRRVHMLRFRSRLLFAEDRVVHHELKDPEWVTSLSSSELKDLCSLRGIKTMHKSTEESTRELKRWISMSLNVSNSNHAYRLHLPVFLFSSCSD